MIIKKRKKPLVLKKYEALLARLPANHPTYEQVMYQKNKHERGYKGELQVDYHLNILAREFTILQDVNLTVYTQSFQMDTVLISPHMLYIVEIKNFRNRIVFDTVLNQFIRDDGKNETGFSHPFSQLNRHKMRLQQWLQENNLPDIPITTFLAISEPRTVIKVIGDHEEISRKVGHGEQIPWKILEVENKLEKGATYPHEMIGHRMLRSCKEYDRDILADHNIQRSDLLLGVRCLNCSSLAVNFIRRKWTCLKCGLKDNDLPYHTINDYLWLIKPWITNSDCNEFLKLNSRHRATRILKNSPQLVYEPLRRRWIARYSDNRAIR